MKRVSGSLRALTVLALSVVPVVGVFVAYSLIYVSSNTAYLTQRNYRVLGTISRQITARLSGVREVVANAAKTCDKDDSGDKDGSKFHACVWTFLTGVPHIDANVDLDTCPTKADASEDDLVDIAGDTTWLYFPYRAATSRSGRVATGCVRTDVRKLVEAQLIGNLFDDFLLSDSRGRILYHQQVKETPGLKTVQGLLSGAKREASTGSKDAASTPSAVTVEGTLSTALQLSYLGEDYLLFGQLVAFSVGKAARTDGPSGRGWMVFGSVRASTFEESAREINPTLLWGLVLLVVLLLLGWPFLKLWLLGPHERLAAFDVYVLAFSCLLASGVLTIFLLDTYTYRALGSRFDRDLNEFAQRIERHLTRELADAYGLLTSFADTVPRRPEAAFAEDAKLGIPVEYPYFTDLVWAKNDGSLHERWMVGYDTAPADGAPQKAHLQRASTPSVSVRDRQYFKDARAGRLWQVHRPGAGAHGADAALMRFAVEPVQSRVTGESTAILAVPIASAAGSPGPAPDVAFIASRLLSLIQPVIPLTFGYAVIDANGLVLFHSDARRNLQENLFQECDNDERLRAAMLARRAEYVDTAYYGQAHRLYMFPLRDTPWSVVVFRNKETARAINSATTITCTTMFTAYVLGFVVVAIGLQLVRRGYRAEWLWPQRDRTASYFVAAAVLLLTAIVGFGVIPHADGLSTLVLIGTAPTLAFGFLYLLLSHRGPQTSWPRRLAGGAIVLSGAGMLAAASGGDAPGRSAVALAALLGAVGLVSFRLDGLLRGLVWPREHAFRTGYAALLSSLVVLIGIAPAAVLFHDAFEQELIVFVRWGQLRGLDSMVDRGARLRSEYADLKSSPLALQQRTAATLDLYYTSFFGRPTAFESISGAARGSRPACDAAGAAACTSLERLRAAALGGETAIKRYLGSLPLQRSYLAALFLPRIPSRKVAIVRTAELIAGCASDGAWQWVNRGGRHMELQVNDPSLQAKLADTRFDVQSAIPPFPAPPGSGWWLGVLFAVLAIGGLIISVLASMIRRIFLLDADGWGIVAVPAHQRSPAFRSWLYVKPGEIALKNSTVCIVDLEALTAPGECATVLGRTDVKDSGIIVVDHFESRLGDAEWTRAKLALCEALVFGDGFRSGTTVIVVSAVEPLTFWAARLVDIEDATDAQKAALATGRKEFERWSEVLRFFVRSCVVLPGAADVPSAAALVGADLAARLAAKARQLPLSGELEAQYWTIWAQCTQDEKLAMIQLVNEGFLNPRATESLRALLRRGLVVRAPAFQLMHPSFARFVRRAESSVQVATWERDAGRSAWANLRMPLMLLLVLAAAFFYYTQRGVYDSTVGLVTGLTASLPLLFRLLGMLGGGADAGDRSRGQGS